MIDPTTWRKASYSGDKHDCVEVGLGVGTIGVQDTKDRGPHLEVSRKSWRSFLRHVTK